MFMDISIFRKDFWDLFLMKCFRNIASVKYQWLLFIYIPIVWGMFHINPGTKEPWISAALGLSFLGGGVGGDPLTITSWPTGVGRGTLTLYLGETRLFTFLVFATELCLDFAVNTFFVITNVCCFGFTYSSTVLEGAGAIFFGSRRGVVGFVGASSLRLALA